MVEAPFLYAPARSDMSFDPKRISRESCMPKLEKPKQEGPLLSFNRHPDSYLFVPYGKVNGPTLSPSVKAKVKWTRMVQLVLRLLEFAASAGILVLMCMIKGVGDGTAWIVRIIPGLALLHTGYATYHLARRASGRTPASSASYMMFASFLDVSIVPFYAFCALAVKTRQGNWQTVLANPDLINPITEAVFYSAIAGAALFLISLGISVYLTYIFRKITQLPPDCNPLEDNLTSRSKHKHKTSTLSSSTTSLEDRLTSPLEKKRSSGAPYQDLSRPPAMPFLQTRMHGPSASMNDYKTVPSSSRDSGINMSERSYPMHNQSPRGSVDHRSSLYSIASTSSPNRQSFYHEVPLGGLSSPRNSRNTTQQQRQTWYGTDSIKNNRVRASKTPKKNGNYEAIETGVHDDDEPCLSPTDIAEWVRSPPNSSPIDPKKTGTKSMSSHINPLGGNPPGASHTNAAAAQQHQRALTEISSNTRDSMDLGDRFSNMPSYGSQDGHSSVKLQSQQQQPHGSHDEFRARFYGELRAGTPPVLVGGSRHVSSGVDYDVAHANGGGRGEAGQHQQDGGSRDVGAARRDVSGKIAEEGRGGKSWGTRFRKISGVRG